MTQEPNESGTAPITPHPDPDVSHEAGQAADPELQMTPPGGETDQGGFPGIAMLVHDESATWRDQRVQYEPVVESPPQAPIEVRQAGVVAYSVGHVSVKPATRVQDVLSGGSVSRDEIRNNLSYLEAPEWDEAWRGAVKALAEKGVIIVVAPRGYGSTTFALRLLAWHAPENAELIRLEADWDSPKVVRLPVLEDCAYQLDLQDPEQDRFDGAFLNKLGEHSNDLKALGSCLVLAVADELWPGHREEIPSDVGVVWLKAPPDPLLLVEKYLTTKERGWLVPYVQQPEAAKHVQGRNAVQAMLALDVVIQQWQEYQLRHEDKIDEFQHLGLDPKLKQAIEKALGDWQDDLDALFDEPGRGVARARALSPEDRCMLMALAIKQSGTAAEIEAAALSLEQSLDKTRGGGNGRAVDAWSVLSGRGLRPRLILFGADIDGGDMVTFNKPGYGEAVLAYVWRNYSRLRDHIITWMVGAASADAESPDRATETLVALIRRLQDAERLTRVRDEAVGQGRSHVIVRVMTEAAIDEHIGHRARTLLYQWATTQRSDFQHVVISVCRALIGKKTDAALVRLGRVASQPVDSAVRAEVLSAFGAAIAHQEDLDHFAKIVAAWRKSNPQAARLGLLALLATEPKGHPWMPSAATEIDLIAGLRDLLAETGSLSDTVPALVNWLKYCARDQSAPYVAAVNLVAEAARDRDAFKAGVEVMRCLQDIDGPNGASVGADLYVAFGRPELRSLEPITKAEE